MSRLDRKAHWENAWQSRPASEVSWYQAFPRLSLEMIHNTGLGIGEGLIDIGGGASLLVDHLLEAGFTDLTVLDISAAALDEAQRRLGDRAERVRWIEADVTRFDPPRSYRVWHDRAALHFLTEAEDQARYADVLCRALAPGGHAVIASFAPGGPEKCSGLDIVQYDAGRLQALLGDRMELCEQAVEFHRTPAGGEQKFGFYRFERIG